MLRARLFNKTWGDWFALQVDQEQPQFHDTFDESLSEAYFTVLSTQFPSGTVLPISLWSKIQIEFDFAVFTGYISAYEDKLATFGEGTTNAVKYVKLSVIELLAVTQYIPLGNLCFTNLIDNTVDENNVTKITITTKKAKEVIQRLSNQIYTLKDGEEAPFKLSFDNSDWWVNIEMPEFTFTELTLFEALKQIGEVVGGFPYLNFVVDGEYELHFQKWDDKNGRQYNWTYAEGITRFEKHSSIENQGYIVDSNIKNLLAVDNSSENSIIYPSKNGAKPPNASTEYYDFVLEANKVELPYKIKELLNLYVKLPFASTEKYYNITQFVVEYEKWITYQKGTWFNLFDINKPYKFSRLYYKYNSTTIGNLTENFSKALLYWINKIDPSVPVVDPVVTGQFIRPIGFSFRVEYIPITEARAKFKSKESNKPIGQIINQESNIVSASQIGSYLQGLVNRMHGKYTLIERTTNRGGEIARIGDFINGEIVCDCVYDFSATTVTALYITSPNFNRRNQFIRIPHNMRQWEIPAGNKTTDRNLHYTENLVVSIGSPITNNNAGSLTTKGLSKLSQYANSRVKPNLAYIAWKPYSATTTDINEQNINYALSTLTAIPIHKSILFHWGAVDNASMGNRVLCKDPFEYNSGGIVGQTGQQYFIEYDELCKKMCFCISDEIPGTYNFDYSITGTDNKELEHNKQFDYTFPMSNKQQFTIMWSGNSLANLQDLQIEKDLSERILFNYQLDFVGENQTIIGTKGVELNPLCNSKANILYKIYVASGQKYGDNDVYGRGQSYVASVVNAGIFNNNAFIDFSVIGYTGLYDCLAITDFDGNILFATNQSGQLGSTVRVYFANKKIEWEKI